MSSKVYIIDYEIVSPIGVGRDALAQGIRDNYTAEGEIVHFPSEGLPFNIAAEIRTSLDEHTQNEQKVILDACTYDRKFELIVACTNLLRSNSSIDYHQIIESERAGVILGIGADSTSFEKFESEFLSYLDEVANPLHELYSTLNKGNTLINVTNNHYDIYSLYLANKFNAAYCQSSVLTACVSSTQAIAFSFDAIRRGETDIMFTGGTDSLINVLAMISFGKLGVISDSTVRPACKPFDLNRRGTLAGECAGIMVMASEEFIMKHNIKPIAELAGYGNSLDAYKITAPDPCGDSMVNAIQEAIQMAGISSDQLDYINAHGTGTRQNDQLELKSLSRALGEGVERIPISSTKDRHGHAIAAAGIQEIILILELMKNSIIPGNLHLEKPCDERLNLVRENFSRDIEYALSTNFAFGGINTALVVKNCK